MTRDNRLNSSLKPVRPLIVYCVTSPLSLRFFTGHVRAINGMGWDVAFICSPGKEVEQFRMQEGATVYTIPIAREISIRHDVYALLQLTKTLFKLKPDVINVSTPKAGLIGGLAGAFARVPCRFYWLLGLRLETTEGLKRFILSLAERIACLSAHRVFAVSPSLLEKADNLGLVRRKKLRVIGPGSVNGVRVEDFHPTAERKLKAEELRIRLKISSSALVVGFVGRITRDKGIGELYTAFRVLRERYPNLCLLLVGDYEEGDPVSKFLRSDIEQDPKVVLTGFVPNPAAYYHLMDVFVLPTYREGFPNVSLEAQAAEIPVVTTNATGAVDSVLNGVSGLIVPAGDTAKLISGIDTLLSDAPHRRTMGQAGRMWVTENFQPESLKEALLEQYASSMSRARLRQRGWRRLLKVTVDKVIATAMLSALLPLMILTAVVIRIGLGSPVLFRQRRPGLNGQPFTLLKFRTMSDERDSSGALHSDEKRLGRLGRLIRSLSLDELPQLWNVIRGDLSLVGPRPLLIQYLDRYTAEQARRHLVLPGVTGWAQVNGRNDLSWEQKFACDMWYVDNWSLWLDTKIIFMTLIRLLTREGISRTGYATAPEFLTSEPKLSVVDETQR